MNKIVNPIYHSFCVGLILLISSCGCKENKQMTIHGSLLHKNTLHPLENYNLKIRYAFAKSGGMGNCIHKDIILPFATDQNGNFECTFEISPYQNRNTYTISDTNELEIFSSDKGGDIGVLKAE